MAKLTLVLVTHDRKLLEIEVDSVTLPGSEGYLGVLPGHTPLISTLSPGVLTYVDGSKSESLVVSSGFCEVSGDVVTVLADSAESPQEVDMEAARELLKEANEELLDAADAALDAAQAKLALAEARLQLGKS
jgi:F-type H+-transporting ATPase subunit epsilon